MCNLKNAYLQYLNNTFREKKQYLPFLKMSSSDEIFEVICEYLTFGNMEDDYNLFKYYLNNGGKIGLICSKLCDFIWFWGDYDDFLEVFKKAVHNNDDIFLKKVADFISNNDFECFHKINSIVCMS